MSAETTPPVPGAFGTWTVRLLALIGVLGCLAVIAIALVMFGLSGIGAGAPAKVEAAATHEVFAVNNVGAVHGTNLIRMDVEASSDQRGSVSRGDSGDRRNVVLLDIVTGASRRVLPDNNRRIADFRFLDRGTDDPAVVDRDDGEGAKGTASPWYMVRIDQPGDTGLEDVMIGSIATGKQAVVLTGIDGVDSAWLADAGHIALILRDHRKLSYRLIDTASFKVSASHLIAID